MTDTSLPARSAPLPLPFALLRWAFFVVLAASLGYFVVFSWHWPILRDTSIMHYVNFLMAHGLRPYQDITDNNLPGAYLAEKAGMLLFGPGDLGWRLCDFATLAVITLSMVAIARPFDWTAGLFGGGMFALLHGSEGPDFPMEREEVVTALLVLGFALLVTSIRRRKPSLTLLFGLSTGAAASIKPTTAPFGLVVLLLALLLVRRDLRSNGPDRNLSTAPGNLSTAPDNLRPAPDDLRPAPNNLRAAPGNLRGNLRLWPFFAWGLAGMLLAGLVVLGYLTYFHALGPLLFLTRTVLPSYVSMANRSLPELLGMMMPRNLLLPALLGLLLALAAVRSRTWRWEHSLLLFGVFFGAVSFVAQRKGSIYHRYPFAAFLLFLLGLLFLGALRRPGWPRLVATAGLLSTLALSIPHYLAQLRSSPPKSTMPFATTLTADLAALEQHTDLQHQVECLDLTYGCFSALYHLGLVENNGFTGDLLLFTDQHNRAVTFYRDWFWRLLQQNPPTVFVLSNEWFPHDVSYQKLGTWPLFATYLRQNYVEVLARSFPPGAGKPSPPSPDPDDPVAGYRIYVRRSSPLLEQLAPAAPATASAPRPLLASPARAASVAGL